jgi:hypothetical protein
VARFRAHFRTGREHPAGRLGSHRGGVADDLRRAHGRFVLVRPQCLGRRPADGRAYWRRGGRVPRQPLLPPSPRRALAASPHGPLARGSAPSVSVRRSRAHRSEVVRDHGDHLGVQGDKVRSRLHKSAAGSTVGIGTASMAAGQARCDGLIGDEAAVDLGLNPHPISWTAFAAKRKVYRLIPTSAAILLVPTYFTLRVRSSLSTGNRLLGYRVGQSVGPVQQAVPRPYLLARSGWHSPGLYGEGHWVDLIPRISRGRCRSCVFATDRVPTLTCYLCTT